MEHLLELENTENYVSAFEEYQKQFLLVQDFELWKHYYFFLWYIIAEDFPLGLENFVSENKLNDKLKEVALFGINNFKNNPQALFILGYTINLFPYYFGKFEEWEEKGNQMLESASNILPNDIIYKLAYLGTSFENQELYNEVCAKAASEVISRFSGIGLYNKYFKQVLYRI